MEAELATWLKPVEGYTFRVSELDTRQNHAVSTFERG